uniref:Uncharacterized protein n=1 Tax=Romanomermis culicivorax TaxID=13658 RepID=A0A915JN79_ROMCU
MIMWRALRPGQKMSGAAVLARRFLLPVVANCVIKRQFRSEFTVNLEILITILYIKGPSSPENAL